MQAEGKAAAARREREGQGSTDMVTDGLAAGLTTLLLFEQALCLPSLRKTGPAMKNEAENPIYE